MSGLTPERLTRLAKIRSSIFEGVPDIVLFRLLAYLHRIYEPELKYVRQLLPARTKAVDVGAWWGPWTYWLARSADEVVTCEPIPHLAAFIESVRPSNVRVINAALSDRAGEASIWTPTRGRGTEGVSSLERPEREEGKAEVSVRVMRLDDLRLEDVGLIKIDVEGHELAVLRGAEDTLVRSRPNLVVEVEERAKTHGHVNEVFEWITSRGYSGKFLLHDAWHPLAEFNPYEHQGRWQSDVREHGYLGNLVRNSRRYVNNFVFTPVSRASGGQRAK
jgi:FkbM family methyltransferase